MNKTPPHNTPRGQRPEDRRSNTTPVGSTVLVAGKLFLTGLLICAIAAAFGVLQFDGTVSDSRADILDLSFVNLSNSARFARGLDELGHDRPQSFSINGNVVHFSVNYSRKRPFQLMKEYQEEFVRQGINTKVWDEYAVRDNPDGMVFDAMTGGVVPTGVSSDYVALGGVVPANEARDEASLLELAIDRTPANKIFTGHHYVEMFWDRNRRESTVTATWSDDEFDYAKIIGGIPTDGEDVDVDSEVPACPGCERLNRMRDLDPARSYSSNIYVGGRNQGELVDFYRRAMAQRGWDETDSSVTLNTARPYIEFTGDEASLLQFSRGSRFLTIVAYPDEHGETTVHTVMGN